MIHLIFDKMKFIYKILFVLAIASKCIYSYDKEMTTTIDAGKKECFFHYVKTGEIIDIEYQVIDGGHGDLDISFELAEPTGRLLYADFKKQDNIHRHEVKIDGDYKFCFDNSFSSFNKKTVFFELIIENDAEENQENKWDELLEGLTPDEFYDMKVQDIQDAIAKVRAHLTRARLMQDLLRSYEARDRNIAEENYFKVNSWSLFQIIAMISVGFLQVVMVRSLFDTNSKVHKIWNKFS